MEREAVLQVMRVKAVELLEVPGEAVQEDKSFVTDLEVDSLSLMEYTMALEDELHIELPEEDLAGITTIGAFLDLIMTKIA